MPVVAAPDTALLVDAAGTLLHPAEPIAAVYVRFAARHGARVVEAEVGRRLRRVMVQARPRRQGHPDWRPYWAEVVSVATGCDSVSLLDALLEYYKRPDAWRLASGAEACARAVAERGMKIAVVSNWDTRLRDTLSGLGVLDWVDTAIISGELGIEKPDPGIFHRACQRLGVEPAKALHVGDDAVDDVAGARDAGCEALRWPVDVGGFAALARRLLSPATAP